MKKKIISSVAALAICGSIVTGATYALFTSESKTNIAIQSGNVNVTATLQNLKIYSPVSIAEDLTYDETLNGADVAENVFANGGTAELTEKSLKLSKMTPGDKASFEIMLDNQSDVAIKYQTAVEAINDTGLFDGLTVTVEENTFSGLVIAPWTYLGAKVQPADNIISVSVELPVGADNTYQGKGVELSVAINAIQANAETVDAWDGSVAPEIPDENVNEESKIVEIYSADELAVVAKQVNSGENSYAGYTLTLMNDIDLNNQEWEPIGYWNGNNSHPFKGAFNGNGYTVSNLKIYEGQYVGLFGYCVDTGDMQNVTIENVNIRNAYVNAGALAGCVSTSIGGSISNVTVKGDVYIDGYSYVGAIEGGQMSYTDIIDCTVDVNEGSIVSARWTYVGGIVGHRGEGNTVTDNCTVKNLIVQTTADAWAYIGGVAGLVSYGNSVTNCTLTNVTVRQLRADIQTTGDNSDKHGFGAIAGITVDNATRKATISGNTFNGTLQTYCTLVNDNVVGYNRSGNAANNLVMENNTINATIING